MALSFIEINPSTALGFGLDFRVDRDSYEHCATDVLYAHKSQVSNTETSLNNITDSYFYPTSEVSCEIVSTDASDNQTITIYYFEDPSAENPSIQQVTLNGTTAVALSNDIFRCRRLVVTSFAGHNSGDVTLYQTGSPANVLATLEPSIGFSRDPYHYIPPNTISVLTKLKVMSECTDLNGLHLIAKRRPSHLASSYVLEAQRIPIYSNIVSLDVVSQPAMTSGTYEICAKKTSGANDPECLVFYEFVLFR